MMLNNAKSKEWSRIRETVIERDGGKCIDCGSQLGPSDTHIHHVIPRSVGGSDTEANLVSLCAACHAGKHLNLQASLGRRFIERWAWRLARWLDHELIASTRGELLGSVMRLLGVKALRPGQLEVILAALRGESVLLVSPTGSGKSFCFQAPTLMKRGTSLVISPLKALMSDQVGGLHRKRIPASFINGDLSPEEKTLRYRLLQKGALKFLYCAPERFDPSRVRKVEIQQMERVRPAFLVIDEAHCIDKWGDAFRPSYRQLGEVRRRLGDPPVLAFTATAGPQTRKRILAALGIPDARVIIQDVDRPNITLLRLNERREVERFTIIATLVNAVRNGPGGKSVIFAPTIKIGNEIAAGLKSAGLDVPFFHGQLRPKDRANLQAQFDGRLEPAIDAMISTSAFGMGIDIPNIRLVIHWQHPASVEDYLQEFGRAGRNGAASLAVLFQGRNDNKLHEWMLNRSLQDARIPACDVETVRREKLRAIRELSEIVRSRRGCFRDAIRRAFGDDLKQGRPFALRVLEWAFAGSNKIRKVKDCCDVCAKPRRPEEWALRVIKRM